MPTLTERPRPAGASHPPLWLSWFGRLAGDTEKTVEGYTGYQDLGAGRRVQLAPTIWEPLPNGGGFYNRICIPIPGPLLLRPRPVLYGYRLWDREVGGEFEWLPLRAAELFEQGFKYLPPAALQIGRDGDVAMIQPNWRQVPAGRNPYRAWDTRQTLYTVPGKPWEPMANVYFDKAHQPVSVELLRRIQLQEPLGTSPNLTAAQSSRLWIGLN